MQPPDLIALFVVPLNKLNIRYMITGAVAAVIYGEPRFTRDLDLVLDLRPGDADRIAAAFLSDAFYVPSHETMEEEARRPRRGHFNLIHHDTALKADCYLAGEDQLHEWAMARRVHHDVGGNAVWVAPIEYVIVRKLEWHRDSGASRQLDDVRAMLRISGSSVDRAALGAWVARLGLENEWRLVAAALAGA
ncbi:MAG: hypothetical protein ACREMM_06925 [Gemmatimonadales bacterium]